MKLKWMLFALIILNSSCNSKSKDNSKNNKTKKVKAVASTSSMVLDFEKNYVGVINKKLKVIFHLKNSNSVVSGFYFYQNKGIDITLKGKIKNGTIFLDEFDFLNNKVAAITLAAKGDTVVGEWVNAKTRKIFKIDLRETEKEIPDFPKNIEGTYKTEYEKGEVQKCNLILELLRKNGDYYYYFTSQTRKLEGRVLFSRSFDNSETYLTLVGIQWAENSGAVSDLPMGVDGLLSENEITIQNYGNAMNYYVKINDCDLKYIHLRK